MKVLRSDYAVCWWERPDHWMQGVEEMQLGGYIKGWHIHPGLV
jgi:hypothetical protein